MTVCAHGSERKPATPATGYFQPNTFGGFLPPELSWLQPFLPFLAPISLDFDAFCALEPPTTELITSEDVLNLLNPSILSLAYEAGYKIAAWVHLYLWYKYCQCKSPDSQPSLPTGQAAPTGLPVINPPGSTSGAVCGVVDSSFHTFHDQDPRDLIGQHPVALFTGDPDLGPGYPVEPTATQAQLDMTFQTGYMFTGCHIDIAVQWHNAANALLRQDTFGARSVGSSYSSVLSVPTGATQVSVIESGYSCTNQSAYIPQIRLTFLCGGGSLLPNSPCCPPDGSAVAGLAQIAAAVATMNDLVTLIQRQAVPFAYVPGADFGPLTDAGVLTLAGALGVRLDVSVPGRVGLDFGSPDLVYDVGRISWGTVDGFTAHQVIDTSPFLSFPPLGGQFTRLAYTLTPGVEVNGTVLVREP